MRAKLLKRLALFLSANRLLEEMNFLCLSLAPLGKRVVIHSRRQNVQHSKQPSFESFAHHRHFVTKDPHDVYRPVTSGFVLPVPFPPLSIYAHTSKARVSSSHFSTKFKTRSGRLCSQNSPRRPKRPNAKVTEYIHTYIHTYIYKFSRHLHD